MCAGCCVRTAVSKWIAPKQPVVIPGSPEVRDDFTGLFGSRLARVIFQVGIVRYGNAYDSRARKVPSLHQSLDAKRINLAHPTLKPFGCRPLVAASLLKCFDDLEG